MTLVMAEFHLAAWVSGPWYCSYWISHTVLTHRDVNRTELLLMSSVTPGLFQVKSAVKDLRPRRVILFQMYLIEIAVNE